MLFSFSYAYLSLIAVGVGRGDVDEGVQVAALVRHVQYPLGALDVDLDGLAQLLVELERGRRVEDDGHVVRQQLQVGRRQAQAVRCDVARHGL